MRPTIGSLFDGSGGFPLAGMMCCIVPKWAAEVEPYPIAVTRSRFPSMKHLGDISKVNGAAIEPVDVITFGSPCQDLSVAGKRAGLKHETNGDEETTRSGLFMEAVRIIKEMREATDGKYPTFALWENVPGAFSSNKGEEFRTVLEKLIKIVEPTAVMPEVPKGGWSYYDSYMGDGWSVAYRTFDAQHWGVPQRRRRIHLVADFRGQRAGEILFKREGLRGYFAQGGTPWEEAAGYDEGSVGADDRSVSERLYNGGSCENSGHRGGTAADAEGWGVIEPQLAVCGGDGIGRGLVAVGFDAYNKALTGDKSMTVTCSASDAHHVPCVVVDPIPIHDKATRYKGGGLTRGGDGAGNGLGVGRPGDPMNTITTGDRHAVAYLASGKPSVGTLMASMATKQCLGDQEAQSGDYHIIEEHGCPVRYIVRRLTPTECARLQGFPDEWGHPDKKDALTDEEYAFWLDVRNTHARINGKIVKDYTREQMLRWYNSLHTDSAEYKMWGNGIALPPALYCMQGIAEALGCVEEAAEVEVAPPPADDSRRFEKLIGDLENLAKKMLEVVMAVKEAI